MYRKYSDEDLVEAYSTMMDYSGKPNVEMLQAIELRGGMEKFLYDIEFKKKHQSEIGRIRKQVQELCEKGATLETLGKYIHNYSDFSTYLASCPLSQLLA
jgi:hypothetical protein